MWERSEKLTNIGDGVEYNLVASRKAQSAVITAVKNEETTVDLNSVGTGSEPGSGSDSGSGSGSSEPTDPSGGGSTNPDEGGMGDIGE